MKIIFKNPFERLQKGAVSALCIVCVLFFTSFGCGGQKSASIEEDDCNDVSGWVVKLKLKPQADESYLPTEDPEIMALLSKHGVSMNQTMPPGPRSTPELMSYYTLTGPCSMSKESRENCIAAFLATGKFEDEVFEYGISHTS